MKDTIDKILIDLEDTKKRLIERGISGSSSFFGCSEKEIEQVRNEAGFPLPQAYYEFLRQMGKGAGRFFEGTDLFYPTMIENTEAAREKFSGTCVWIDFAKTLLRFCYAPRIPILLLFK